MKYKRSPTTTQKANCDYTSISGFVIEKNSTRGPKHGDSERQEISLKEVQSDDVQRKREAAPEAERTKTCHASEDRQNQGTIPMPTFAPRPLTTISTMSVELPQNYMVRQQSDDG